MKLCFTAKGATLDSLSEDRFGRAPYFIIVESENGSFEAIPNPYADGAGGVGPKAAQVLIAKDVKALISGQVGGNAREVYLSVKIRNYYHLLTRQLIYHGYNRNLPRYPGYPAPV